MGKHLYRQRELYHRKYGKGVGTVFKAVLNKFRPVVRHGVSKAIGLLRNNKNLKDVVRPLAERALNSAGELAKEKLMEVAKEKVISRLPKQVVEVGEKVLANPEVQHQLDRVKESVEQKKRELLNKLDEKVDMGENVLRDKLYKKLATYSGTPLDIQNETQRINNLLTNENLDLLNRLVGQGLKRKGVRKGRGRLGVRTGTGLSLL